MPADQDLVDAKIAASEARSDTKLARLDGKMDLFAEQLKGVAKDISDARRENGDSRKWIIGTVIGTAAVCSLGMAAIIVSMALYGDALFGRGLEQGDLIKKTITETLRQTPAPAPAPAPTAPAPVAPAPKTTP